MIFVEISSERESNTFSSLELFFIVIASDSNQLIFRLLIIKLLISDEIISQNHNIDISLSIHLTKKSFSVLGCIQLCEDILKVIFIKNS
jgi:hypothetical protein